MYSSYLSMLLPILYLDKDTVCRRAHDCKYIKESDNIDSETTHTMFIIRKFSSLYRKLSWLT